MRFSLSGLVLACLAATACDGVASPTDASRLDGGASDAGASDAGASDAGRDDAGAADAATPDAGPPPPTGPALYPAGARHSPIPEDLAARLASIAASGPTLADDRFMKVGDSITVSSAFLHCFDGGAVDLDGRPLDGTVARFAGSWSRTSEAATVGWSAFAALDGAPSPLDREHAATQPRFATVMFGTNDAGFRTPEAFARDVWEIAETLALRGTIPLLSTIPPRDDSASADANVPLYNLAVRAIAQGLGVPLVDLHHELAPLPSHGLAGDGVHPRAFGGGACVLSAEALANGYNVRNVLTLEQLDRAVRAVGGEALDPDPPRLVGAGTAADPYVVPSLPFAAMGDTTDGDRGVDTYGCATANEAGPARIYRVEVPSGGRLTALALSDRDVDVDVHLLEGRVAADACAARDDTRVIADVGPGTWYVAVDTFVGGSGERPGRYLVALAIE